MRIYKLFESVRKHLHAVRVERAIRHRGQFYHTAKCVTSTVMTRVVEPTISWDGAGGGSDRLDSRRTPADPSADPTVG